MSGPDHDERPAPRRPWVRGELAFLRSGPLWRVHTTASRAVDDFVAAHDYRRLDLDGLVMTSRAGAHGELARVFAFPDWYGGNWDAFNDCLYAVVADDPGGRIALVWNDFETSATAAPATASEVVWALLEARQHRDLVLDVFVLGSGDDFDRP